MHIFALASSHALRMCDKTFYFLFFGFIRFTHDSYLFNFFFKKRVVLVLKLLMWERNVEVGKNNLVIIKKKKGYVCGKKKTILFYIYFQKEEVILVLDN